MSEEKKELKEEDISKVNGGNWIEDNHLGEPDDIVDGYCNNCKKKVKVYFYLDAGEYCFECGSANVNTNN